MRIHIHTCLIGIAFLSVGILLPTIIAFITEISLVSQIGATLIEKQSYIDSNQISIKYNISFTDQMIETIDFLTRYRSQKYFNNLQINRTISVFVAPISRYFSVKDTYSISLDNIFIVELVISCICGSYLLLFLLFYVLPYKVKWRNMDCVQRCIDILSI